MERVTTTFHQDFNIAEHFGIEAVKKTFMTVFAEWRTNYLYLTELVIVLNHRCWYHYEQNQKTPSQFHQDLSQMYSDYYYQARDYALDNLKGKEFEHFYRVTD